MFNVQCFFYAYFKITISRINHFKTITRVVVFTGCAWWQMFFDRRRWSGMFLYPGGQMSDSFANIGTLRQNSEAKVEYDKVETVFLIPYIGLPSVTFGRKLKRLLKDYYCIDVKVVFSSFKVKNYFSLKCHTPMPLMANVVYQFTCLRDANSTYIGKTIRHLAIRVKEHATASSAIKEHLSSCTTCKDNYSCNSFKVIDSANSDFEVSIKEALHIKHRNPNLNKQLSTQGMYFMLKIFT